MFFKSLITASILFVCNLSFATYLPSAPQIRIGTSVATDDPGIVDTTSNLNSVVVLSAYVASSTTGNFLGLYSNSSQTTSALQYYVPDGKTLYVSKICAVAGAANAAFTIGYGAAALASDNTSSIPAGNVIYGSAITGVIDTANSFRCLPLPVSFPEKKFPYFKTNTNANLYNAFLIGILK
jgi:hypothetical protein